MSDMVKKAAIWSFLKLTALYFTMSAIVHAQAGSDEKRNRHDTLGPTLEYQIGVGY